MKKLKNILLNETDRLNNPDQTVDVNKFTEMCRNYSQFGSVFEGLTKIESVSEQISWLVESAESVILKETDSWFDKITVTRHMKQLKEAEKVLSKTTSELRQLQQRYESAYSDIGNILNTYYDI